MGWSTRLRNSMSNMIAPKNRIGEKSPTLPPLNLNVLKNSISEMTMGLSQPVWGPEISTVGSYSREGYTSKTFDRPSVSFRNQAIPLEQDEDVQLAVNQLASMITAGEHYIKTGNDLLTTHFEKLSKDIHFDIMDTQIARELLWFGNSVWKPRMGIANVRTFNDLMHIPISSFVKVWWDRQRQPYKYEFRGAEYQGYHNPGEIMHFKWNPVDASVFGTGFGISVTSTRTFPMPTPNGFEDFELPAMLDRKYATQFNMQIAEQRYISSNIWSIPDGSEDERAALQSKIEQKTVGQDIVAGAKVDVQELGSNARNFNSEQFTDLTLAPIFKALNNSKGKNAGQGQTTYNNAKNAAELDEIGLAAFPIAMKTQLEELLFKPWYMMNPITSPEYYGGIIPIPWDEIKFNLEFGAVQKKDIPVKEMTELIKIYMESPMIKDPKVIHDLFKQAGLDLGEYDATDALYNDPSGMMALNNIGVEQSPKLQQPPNSDIGGGPIPQFNNQVIGSPPNDEFEYNSMMKDVRGNPFVKTNFRQSDPAQDWNTGRNYE